MLVNFYQRIKTLSEKWDANLKKFLEDFSSEKVLIILFGSRSRKDHNFLSDYDIVMITENEIDKPKTDFPSDLFVFSITEAFELLENNNFIIKNALKNGQILLNNISRTNELLSLADS